MIPRRLPLRRYQCVVPPVVRTPFRCREEWASQGCTKNSSASDRLVVWLLVLPGSRYQSWAWTTAATPGFLVGFGQLGHQSAFRSWENAPSQAPTVPLPAERPARITGGTTH